MNKAYISGVALALAISAGSAFAAGAPPHLPPPPPMWTGFYVGLNAGWSGDASPNVITRGAPVAAGVDAYVLGGGAFAYRALSHGAASALSGSGVAGGDGSGFLGGGQIGYNRLIGNYVVGFETDFQGSTMSARSGFSNAASAIVYNPNNNPNDSFTDVAFSRVATQKSLDWLGTVRGRLGVLFTPALLAYATGGLAYGGATLDARIVSGWAGANLAPFGLASSGASGRFSGALVGWTVGAGGEWMFMPNLSAKVEYLYYDLGEARVAAGPSLTTYPFAASPNATMFTSHTRFDGHIARAGLNYHFNWGSTP